MSNGLASAHEQCHVHTFEDDIVVDIDCRLEQAGEVAGFLLCDQDAEFIVDVTVSGRLAEHLCFEECVAVHIECFGPEDPGKLEVQRFDYDCNSAGVPVTFRIPIPAGHLCDPGEAECGLVCCFAATLTTFTKCGDPGHISCFCKGPCVGIHRTPAHRTAEAAGTA